MGGVCLSMKDFAIPFKPNVCLNVKLSLCWNFVDYKPELRRRWRSTTLVLKLQLMALAIEDCLFSDHRATLVLRCQPTPPGTKGSVHEFLQIMESYYWLSYYLIQRYIGNGHFQRLHNPTRRSCDIISEELWRSSGGEGRAKAYGKLPWN
jgi:hypothetical protein